jgi:hypothetical protein
MVTLDIEPLVNHSGELCEEVETFVMCSPAVRENHRVKLEKVPLGSRTKSAEPSSLAD